MGDVVFCCQHCREPLIVDDAGIGLDVPCPRCGTAIQIPPSSIPTDTMRKVLGEQSGTPPPPPPLLPHPSSTGPIPEIQHTPRPMTESGVALSIQPEPSPWPLWFAMALLGLIALALALALYVQSVIGLKPVAEPVTPAPASTLKKTTVQLGEPASLGTVRLVLHRAMLGPDLVDASLGEPGIPALVFEASLENTGKAPLYLAYLWGNTQITDQKRRILPALVHKGEAAAVNAGTPPDVLEPGATLNTLLAFQPFPDDADRVLLVSHPGVWAKTVSGQFVPALTSGFQLDLTRAQILARREAKAASAPP